MPSGRQQQRKRGSQWSAGFRVGAQTKQAKHARRRLGQAQPNSQHTLKSKHPRSPMAAGELSDRITRGSPLLPTRPGTCTPTGADAKADSSGVAPAPPSALPVVMGGAPLPLGRSTPVVMVAPRPA